jgi:hypothetical protein
MPSLQPDDISGGAKLFMETEWGQWYLGELQRIEETHLRLGQKTDAHNLTINSTMRAAGLREAIDLIENGVKAANVKKK